MYPKEKLNVGIEKSVVLDAEATTLAEMIRNQVITSTDATRIYIDHIEKMNPAINFLVEDRFSTAMIEAENADRKIAIDQAVGKLFGVPMSMKESFHVEGMRTTGGLVHRKESIQTMDAEVVRKLKQEGAILLGKTNTPELCFCQETDNKLYGRTNNPRDLTRTVGGSSGGEAALIAIGGAAAGIGSDIGGSIRFPSHFNGVIGFKSGKGQISSFGSFPVEEDELQSRMLGIGPITKTVRDAKLIYNIIAKKTVEEQPLDKFTINILPVTDYPLSQETISLLKSTESVFEKRFSIERKVPPYFKESASVWQEIMSINGAATARKEAFSRQSINPLNSYLTERLSGKAENHRYLSWALIGATLFKPKQQRVKEIRNFIATGDAVLEEYLNERILLFPVYHSTAPKHGVVYKEIFSVRKTFRKYMPYIAYANVWGLPSLTIPVGEDRDGMPIGLQLMSKNGNEGALFELGLQIEKEYSAYKRVI